MDEVHQLASKFTGDTKKSANGRSVPLRKSKDSGLGADFDNTRQSFEISALSQALNTSRDKNADRDENKGNAPTHGSCVKSDDHFGGLESAKNDISNGSFVSPSFLRAENNEQEGREAQELSRSLASSTITSPSDATPKRSHWPSSMPQQGCRAITDMLKKRFVVAKKNSVAAGVNVQQTDGFRKKSPGTELKLFAIARQGTLKSDGCVTPINKWVPPVPMAPRRKRLIDSKEEEGIPIIQHDIHPSLDDWKEVHSSAVLRPVKKVRRSKRVRRTPVRYKWSFPRSPRSHTKKSNPRSNRSARIA